MSVYVLRHIDTKMGHNSDKRLRHKTGSKAAQNWIVLDYFGFVSNTSKNQETNFYLLAEEKIQIVDSIKYLGVYLNSKFMNETHLDTEENDLHFFKF